MKISDKKLQEIQSGNHNMMRATNNKDISILASKLHSLSVKSGIELEKIIYDEVSIEKYQNIGILDINFNNTQIINKLKFHQKGLNKELDFCRITETEVYLLELKDGEKFDSGQPSTWINNRLLEFGEIIKTLTDKKIIFKLVLFNCSDVMSSSVNLSNIEKEKYLMNGIDFCNLLNIDFKSINMIRNSFQIETRRDILMNMIDIVFDTAIHCVDIEYDKHYSFRLNDYLENYIIFK